MHYLHIIVAITYIIDEEITDTKTRKTSDMKKFFKINAVIMEIIM